MEMKQLKPMQVVTNYKVGAVMGGLAERGVRGLFGAARRHPRVVRGAGAFGVGYLTAEELAKRRRRKKGYALDVAHFTPDIPAAFDPRVALKAHLAKLKGTGKLIGKTASATVKAAVIGLAAKELLDLLAKRRPRMAWMPEVRPDIELSGYETLDQVVQYASVMPSKMLKTIHTKAGAVLHKTKVGVERGLLMWLMGFISAELLSRGITKPKRRHEVVFPEAHSTSDAVQRYARWKAKETGEQLSGWGYQPFTPTKTIPEPLPKFKRHRLRKVVKRVGAAATLPIGALLALRVLRTRKQEGYAFGPAAMKVGRGLKWGFKHPKVTKLLGKKAPLPARAGSFVRRRPGTVAGVAGGALALRELRKIRKQRAKQGYSFRSAAKRTAKVAGKVGGGLGKTLGVASNIAIPALIISELWPKKKQRLTRPPVQSSLSQPYGLFGQQKKLVAMRHAREIALQKLRIRVTRSRMKQALKLRGSRVKRGMFQLQYAEMPALERVLTTAGPVGRSLRLKLKARRLIKETRKKKKYMWDNQTPEFIQTYPFKSAAQRRWMHMKKPKMAKEWEEHTPEGKKLPEHVSKHQQLVKVHRRRFVEDVQKVANAKRRAMLRSTVWKGIAIGSVGAHLVRSVIAQRKEKVSKHALSVPWALKRARDLVRLKGAKSQGREVVEWARKLAKTLRAAQLKTADVKRKVELGARAGKWETVADQVGDVLGRGQLEKVGLLAAATAAGTVGHEVGKKRERARVHRVVG